MPYNRVIPRDLFNEAKLLKCLGQLVIKLETAGAHRADLRQRSDGQFEIEQREYDGGIYCATLDFYIRGHLVNLFTPLNSRLPYPLMFEDEDAEVSDFVFNDDGSLSAAFIEYLTGA